MTPDSHAVPLRLFGAPSVGGLRLPDAQATARGLYAPRGVAWLPGGGLAVSDTGNHRVLLWHTLPDDDHAPADVVLGQADFTTEGPNAAGRGPTRGLHLPTGLVVADGRLLVADAWNHRVVVWNEIPTRSDQPPDVVLGQPDAVACAPNRGGPVGAAGFHGCYGLAVVDGSLWVTDAHNRRVLVWDQVPGVDRPADRVIGQDDFTRSEENRGRGPGADTFRWPHAVQHADDTLWIADAGNHRVLGWTAGNPPEGPADRLLGQSDFASAFELPHRPQGAHRLRFPYALAASTDHLWVADTANNRVLGYSLPLRSVAADRVLAQPDFDQSGENRWSEIGADTLCWPYGLATDGPHLAIADSGNNRVVVWRIAP